MLRIIHVHCPIINTMDFSSMHVGAAYIYIFFQLDVWLLGHVIILFWGITFPFHYRSFDLSGRLKYIHIATIVVALLLPSIPVGIAFGTGGYTYDGIPPISCLPRNAAVGFYATFLPSTVLVSIGATFLTLILWKLVKVRLDFVILYPHMHMH